MTFHPHVIKDCIYDFGEYYVYRYTSTNPEELRLEAAKDMAGIPAHRNPHAGSLHRYMTLWAIEISFYGKAKNR